MNRKNDLKQSRREGRERERTRSLNRKNDLKQSRREGERERENKEFE